MEGNREEGGGGGGEVEGGRQEATGTDTILEQTLPILETDSPYPLRSGLGFWRWEAHFVLIQGCSNLLPTVVCTWATSSSLHLEPAGSTNCW